MTTNCERCGRPTHAQRHRQDVTWCPRDCTPNVLSRNQRRVLADTVLFVATILAVTFPVSPWAMNLVWP